MKTIKQFGFALAIIFSLTLSSCGGSDDNGGGGFSGPATGTFIKAKVGGSNFLSEGEFAVGNMTNGAMVLQVLVHQERTWVFNYIQQLVLWLLELIA